MNSTLTFTTGNSGKKNTVTGERRRPGSSTPSGARPRADAPRRESNQPSSGSGSGGFSSGGSSSGSGGTYGQSPLGGGGNFLGKLPTSKLGCGMLIAIALCLIILFLVFGNSLGDLVSMTGSNGADQPFGAIEEPTAAAYHAAPHRHPPPHFCIFLLRQRRHLDHLAVPGCG